MNKNEQLEHNKILDEKLEEAGKQRDEINQKFHSKDYIVTIFQTGDKLMSLGEFEKQDTTRRFYQVCSLSDLPEVIGKMKRGFWSHPDLKEDLSNSKKIPQGEKKWGVYYSILIEPLTKEMEDEYLEKSKTGFFEHWRKYGSFADIDSEFRKKLKEKELTDE